MNVPVFVPKGPLAIKIRPGSGIVGGQLLNNGRQMVYFEGNLYGAPDLQRYVERVHRAWSRMVEKAASTAKAAFAPEELVLIGEYDPARMLVLVDEAQRETLMTWLGLTTAAPSELIWRNPLQIKTFEHFLNIVGSTGDVHALKIVDASGALTDLTCRWDDETKSVRCFTPEIFESSVNSLEPLIASGRLYLTLSDIKWGVGW